MDDEEPTQGSTSATQDVLDRRPGFLDLDEEISDIICILYPHSDQAGLEVQRLADNNSPHIGRKHNVDPVERDHEQIQAMRTKQVITSSIQREAEVNEANMAYIAAKTKEFELQQKLDFERKQNREKLEFQRRQTINTIAIEYGDHASRFKPTQTVPSSIQREAEVNEANMAYIAAKTKEFELQHKLDFERQQNHQKLEFQRQQRTNMIAIEHGDHASRFKPTRAVQCNYAIILRLTSHVKDPRAGFVFGRNHLRCDVVFAHDPQQRISNMHFRIYPNEHGSVLIEGQSTNGTFVDGHLLSPHQRAEAAPAMPVTPLWVLSSGAMIKVNLHDPAQDLEFRVHIPRRDDEDKKDYLAKIREHSAWHAREYPSDPGHSKLSVDSTFATESKRRRLDSPEHGFSDEASSSAIVHPVKRLKTLPASQYTIAWICTLQLHLEVATMMLDEVHVKRPAGVLGPSEYILGSIGQHNVVIACPTIPSHMKRLLVRLSRSFPTIKLGVIVGSAGGIPSSTLDIRLGDVVVGIWRVLYRADESGTADLLKPLADSIVSTFRARHEADNGGRFESILESQSKKRPDYTRPNLRDRLFRATYSHLVSEDAPNPPVADSHPARSDPFNEVPDCKHCDDSQIVLRSMRTTQVPRVHFGGILSSPTIIKDAALRDQLAHDFSMICVDHCEADKSRGIPWIHIRGICDYSDTHGNRGWQRFAALSAASLAKDLITDVPVAIPLGPDPHGVPTDDPLRKRREVLQSFRFDAMDARRGNIKPALGKTCDWLLELPEYQQWLEFRGVEQHHGIFWLRGKPGVGKSTVMKFAYDKMREQHHGIIWIRGKPGVGKSTANKFAYDKRREQQHSEPPVVVSFFFNFRGDDLEKGMFGLYRSLLTQILETLPALQTLLDGPHIPWLREDCPCPSLDILKVLLKDAVSKLGQRSLTCFIDALDECDSQEAEDIVGFFQDLSDTAVKEGIRLRICISSRHYPCIDSRTGLSVTLEALEGHAADLCQYVQQRLRVNGDVDELRNTIVEKSAGVFVWVVEMVRMLNKIKQRGEPLPLKKLPLVSGQFNDMLRNIFRRDDLHMEEHGLSIMWILCAVRPLGLHEYQHALWSALAMRSYDNDPPPLGDTDERTASATRRVVVSSKGLAEVTPGGRPTVQFVHETVRTFLIKEGGFIEPSSDGNVYEQGTKHEFIKKCCSFYLNYEASTRKRDQPSPRTHDFVLLEYAAHNILHHAECAAEMVDQQMFLVKFDMNEWLEAYNATEHNTARQYDPGTLLIYVLADRGLPQLIRFWLKAYSMVHALHYPLVTQSRYRHPIFAALASGNKDAVAALLGTPSPVVYGCDITEGLTHRIASDFSEFAAHTPLTWAAGRGLPGIVLWMLECGVNVAELDEGGHTALSRACADARLEVVQLLLKQGAHPDRDAPYQEKPLVQAAQHGHVEACQLVLDAGADLEALDKHGHTALSGACAEGRLEVVVYLLSFGATLNLGNHHRRNPLVEACRGGHFDLVRVLLKEGAQVNSHDGHGWTSLKRAAEKGHVQILRLLLDNRADVDFRGSRNSPLKLVTRSILEERRKLSKYSVSMVPSSFTPMMVAIANDHLDAMRLLLASGTYVNARSDNGLTPLLVAARKGHCSMAQLLLESGADVNVASENGMTAIMFAAGEGSTDLVELLVSHKAGVNAVSKSGLSPLMFAAREGHHSIVQTLLGRGADVNVNSVRKLSALTVAITGRYDSVVELLLDAGAYPNVRDHDGMTPLMFASQTGSDKIRGLLLKAGADFEVINADGVPPLVLGVGTGQTQAVRDLPDRGAVVSAEAPSGVLMGDPGLTAVLMAHEPDSQLAPTDSGYASTYMTERKIQSDDETGTLYSVVSTSRPLSEENYIVELASQLISGVSLSTLDNEITERIVSILPGLLKDFALKVGHGEPVQMERDAMAFVHKHRNEISSKFIELSGEKMKEAVVKPTEDPEEMTWHERVGLLDRDPDEENRVPATSEDDLPSPQNSSRLPTPSAPSESSLAVTETEIALTRPNGSQSETQPRGQLHVYSDHLASGDAYQWLLTRLQREIDHVTIGESSLDSIRQTILSSLPPVRKLSRKLPSPTCNANFHVDWDILNFFEEQGYPQPWEEALEHILTLTGSSWDAHALTCAQYMRQIWPGTGDALVEWLKKTIREGIGIKCKRKSQISLSFHEISANSSSDELSDGMTICGEIVKSGLTVEVSGVTAFVVEAGEQLAWLGASMQISPEDDGIMLCTPSVSLGKPGKDLTSPLPVMNFDISFRLEKVPQPRSNGQCWHSLFRNPVVVKGYPIPRRVDWNTGLEIPLDILVGLARSQRVDEFKSKIYIKGFSTLLVATKRSNDTLHWHLIFNEDGSQVSFLDDTLPPEQEIRHLDVLGSRHIVGWCLKAEVHAGAPSAQYPFEYVPPNRAPEGGALAHVVVQVGQTIVPPRAIFGLKDTPRHVSHESDYVPRLESLHRRFVLLWDEQDKRGWLVNGTSALLHVLRASLKHSTKGPLRNRLVCRSEHLKESNEPLEVDTAIDVLANQANFNLQLYDGDKHTLLKGQIEHFCYVFEKLFEYQRDAMGDVGKTLCKTPRGSLEGWDFEDLVRKEEQLYPCASRIESAGKGWVDFTRSISAVTVLARGFGEMIKPGGNGFCNHWGELPKGLYYIASATKDLEGLTRRYSRGTDNVVQLSESLVWHTPTTCFAACECHEMIHESRCEPVQTILPAQLSGTARPRDRRFERRGAGAVIFGHNSYFPWRWEDTGDPVPIQPTNTVTLVDSMLKESDSFKDSALGTSPSVSSASEADPQSRARQLPLLGNNQMHRKALIGSMSGNARQHSDYTVGIICALPKELRAVRLLFDDGHHEPLPIQDNDSNIYVLGKMGQHLVVATCLPSKDIGTASAAVTAASMIMSFASVRFILLVGIAGGVRSENHDIRLGDVVISRLQGTTSGVVSYDQGAEHADQSFERRGLSMGPSRLLCAALSIMESAPDPLCFGLQPHLASIAARDREYRRPGHEADKQPRMECNSCNLRQTRDEICCNEPKAVPFILPEIHYGVIASGNRVVKSAEFRDQVAGQYNALCFEMEAAGVFKATSNCLVIRGISDYCDEEKNDSWQKYAAAAAASYAKVLLHWIPAKRNGNAAHWGDGMEETSRKRRRV